MTVPVTVATPEDEVSRDEGFDFHHEEETAVEGGVGA